MGHRVASGGYEKQLHAQAVAYANAQNAAIEDANRAAEAERKRAVSAAEARGRASATAQEVTHAIAADTDLSCEWRDDHRLRIEQTYAAYGYRPDGTAAGMPDSVPAAAINSDTSGTVGRGGIPLGRGLQVAPR